MSVASAMRVGAYQLVERVRGPALAERYRALDKDGHQVILHLIHPAITSDASFRTVFLSHARAAAALRQPAIAHIVDFGELDGRPFIAVEDVGGEDLATRLASLHERGDRLPRRAVRQVVQSVATALGRAHEQGVVHGDVRPGNVVVTAAGAAVLTGFALGRALRAATTGRVAVGAASPAYVAPEVAAGAEPDHRSDLYSLAVVAYELLAGRPPYVGEPPLAVLLAHGREPLPLPSQLDAHIGPDTERVLLRALARDPMDRHESASAFAKSLDSSMARDGQRGGTVFVPLQRDDLAAIAQRSSLLRAGIGGATVALLFATTIAVAWLVARPSPAVTVSAVPSAAPVPATAVPTTPSAPTAMPTATVLASPTPLPAPTPAAPAVGALIYEAALDGSVELNDIHTFSGGRTDSAVTFERGAIQLQVRRALGGIIAFFRMPASLAYVGQFEVSVPSGSEVLFSWALRRDGDASYLLRLDARTETLSLLYDDGVRWREALAPQMRISDLRSGRSVAIAFSVAGPEIAVYVDGGLVMKARDARIARSQLPLDIFVGEEGGIGAIRILSARLHAAP